MFSKASKPKAEPPKKVDITYREYFDVLFATLNKKTVDGRIPDAVVVLTALMDYYAKKADTYLHYLTMSHGKDAANCKKLLEQEPRSEALARAFDAINKTADTKASINANGDYALLIGTTCAVFPECLELCNDKVKEKIKDFDIWNAAIATAFTAFMNKRKTSPGSPDHETLEYLSTIVPTKLADQYADFLLGQLKVLPTHEALPGLYKGWIYAALGTLCARVTPDKDKKAILSIEKQAIINTALTQAFRANTKDISIVGLCEALNCAKFSTQQVDQGEIADRLCVYTMKEMPSLQKLYTDEYPATVNSYLRKIFTTLNHLQPIFLNDDHEVMRNGLMNALLQQDRIYPFREGIRILQDWIDDNTKLDFLDKLDKIQPKFKELAPIFWHWFKKDKNHIAGNKWALCHQYDKYIPEIQRDLLADIKQETPTVDDIRFLIAESTHSPEVEDRKKLTRSVTRNEIVNHLKRELKKYNQPFADIKIKSDLHQALAEADCWTSREQRCDIAPLLLHATDAMPNVTDEARISAANAAAVYCEHLETPEEKAALRDNLLSLLKGVHAKKAAEALLTFATNMPNEELPILMTYLLNIDNEQAKFLLAHLHKDYEQMNNVHTKISKGELSYRPIPGRGAAGE